jgi:hypothetical protein
VTFASFGFASGPYAGAASGEISLSNFSKAGVVSFVPPLQVTSPNYMAALKALGPSWYYNYESRPHVSDGGGGPGPEFVPMIYNAADATSANVAAAVRSGANHLLTFNEPDQASQANMTVAEALALWPTILEARTAGMLIGSPAMGGDGPVGDAWLADFWAGLAPADRPDFICLHTYLRTTETLEEQAAYLIERVNDHYATYGLPVWVTEWGLTPFGGGGDPTLDQVEALLRRGFYELDANPNCERQSWFCLPYFVNSFLINTYLYDNSWNITQIGSAFQDLVSEYSTTTDTGRDWGTDGYSYFEPKEADIERMLKVWNALEDFENAPPPEPVVETARLERRGAPEPTRRIPAKTEPAFEWWDKNAKPEPQQWTAKRGSKFEWWKQ